MAELETMLGLGGSALLEVAELAAVINALGRAIPLLRIAVAIFRRVRTQWKELRYLLRLPTRAPHRSAEERG